MALSPEPETQPEPSLPPKTVLLPHGKGGLQQYFKEFIMIFLAITLGFFVENLREDMAEKNLEREYMQEIVENLKYDTTRYRANFEVNEFLLTGLDSLKMELKNARDGSPDANRLYYFAFKYRWLYSVALFNTSAMTELKHSGSIRLIKNKKLVANLADYYERKLKAMDIYRPSEANLQALEAERISLFSTMEIDDYLKALRASELKPGATGFDMHSFLTRPKMHLQKSSIESFERYYATLSNYEIRLMDYQFFLNENKNAAIDLMNEITQEYHFE